MDSLKIKFILSYFQVCGLCYFTNLNTITPKKMKHFMLVWSCVHLLILSSIVSIATYNANHAFVMSDMITTAIDVLQWMLPVISHYITIIESFRTRNIKDHFWAQIRYIDAFLLSTSLYLKQKLINRYCIKLVIVLVSTMAIDIFVLIRVRNDELWRNKIIVSLYTFLMCRSEVLFCVLFIETLRYRTDMLTARLKKVRYRCKNQFNLLRCCKKAFEVLWLSVDDINRAFGTSVDFKKIQFFFYNLFSSILINFFQDGLYSQLLHHLWLASVSVYIGLLSLEIIRLIRMWWRDFLHHSRPV